MYGEFWDTLYYIFQRAYLLKMANYCIVPLIAQSMSNPSRDNMMLTFLQIYSWQRDGRMNRRPFG